MANNQHHEEERFRPGDIRSFFKRDGQTRDKEMEPEAEVTNIEEPITTPDNNGIQRMTMM